jgi:hypothetical protein
MEYRLARLNDFESIKNGELKIKIGFVVSIEIGLESSLARLSFF